VQKNNAPVSAETIGSHNKREKNMNLRIVFLFSLVFLLVAGSAGAQQTQLEKAAVVSAEKWLAVADNGKYADCWEKAAAYSKNAVSKEQWVKAMQSFRKPLGRLVSRKVRSTTFKTSLPETPKGKYVVITFKSVFEKKKSAIETVTPMLDKDGTWRVTGYFIH
jgi:hypothetical protein